jgi:hypothetical protein
MICLRFPARTTAALRAGRIFDTPPLRGNSEVAQETPELLIDGVRDMRILETHEFPLFARESRSL